MKLRPALTIIAIAFLAGACGEATGLREGTGEGRAHALAALKRGSGADRIGVWYRNIAELLPNTKYAEPGDTPKPITSRVFVGRVASVTEGKGFWVPEGDAPGGTVIGFDDGRAMWKTVHLEVTVERSLDDVSKPGELVHVGLATGPDAEVTALADGLRALGNLVFFLFDDSPVFEYRTDLRAIVEDGSMIATIDGEGRLGLPALEEGRAEPMLEGVETLAELEKRAAEPDHVIALKRDGGIVVRA